MTPWVYGISHHSAPFPLLERVALDAEGLHALLDAARERGVADEAAGLSTCNRTEFYFVAAAPEPFQRLVEEYFAAECRGLRPEDYTAHFYLHAGEAAPRHLLRVAAGIDSLVVGESESLGQLRRAWEQALGAGHLGEVLGPALQRALAFGRRVRTETGIARGSISIASLAYRQAAVTFPDVAARRLLVVGAGEAATQAVRHFAAEGIGGVEVLNRTHEGAEKLAAEVHGTVLPADRLEEGLLRADVVVVATGAPHHVLTAPVLAAVVARREGRPLSVLDLAMPRNVDPAVGALPNVALHSLDSLRRIAEENKAQRREEIALVEELATREAREYLRWTRGSEVGRLIAEIRRRAEAARQEHLARHGGAALPEEERLRLERFGDSLVRAVLHDVTKALRGVDPGTEQGARDVEALGRLFSAPKRPSPWEEGTLGSKD